MDKKKPKGNMLEELHQNVENEDTEDVWNLIKEVVIGAAQKTMGCKKK